MANGKINSHKIECRFCGKTTKPAYTNVNFCIDCEGEALDESAGLMNDMEGECELPILENGLQVGTVYRDDL